MTPSHPHHAHSERAKQASCAILTVSDSRKTATDESGKLIKSLLEASGHKVFFQKIVPDEKEKILGELQEIVAHGKINCLILSGGTGIAPRDITAETLQEVLDKPLPGFGELFRFLSYKEVGSASMLSRALAGVMKKVVVFSLPGSPKGVSLAMEKLILPELSHMLGLLFPADSSKIAGD